MSAFQVKRLLKFVRQPGLIFERLTEKKMERSAYRFFASRTREQNATERLNVLQAYADAATFAEEAQSSPIYQQLLHSADSADKNLKIALSQTTSLDDCITLYVLVRLWRPKVMVETGVFYGAISAMILDAMAHNGQGRLYSIDLPIEDDGLPPELRGGLVPDGLRSAWTLILGDSRLELPRLLANLPVIDAFNHDSLHRTRHMTWEYETAWPLISAAGFLSSHDVAMTPSWSRFCQRHSAEIELFGQIYGVGVAHKRP